MNTAKLLIACLVLASCTVTADAQVPRMPYGHRSKKNAHSQQYLEKFAVAGTIEGLQPGKILMRDNANANFLIFLNPQTALVTTGNVQESFLRADLFVRFEAEIDRHRNVTRPIDRLALISPSRENVPGIYPAAKEREGAHLGKIFQAGHCIIVGKITSMQNKKLQVNTGHGTVNCELSESPKIVLQVNDYSMARKGDKIQVEGERKRTMPRQIKAARVRIELAQTLSGMREHAVPTKRPRPSRFTPPQAKGPKGLPFSTEEKLRNGR
ncbi:MAG: hypothetical protein ACWGMZ_05125 [Thermoguttaceae bacterium]